MTSKLLLFALCAAFVHARPANPEDKADGYVVYDYTIEIPSDASLSQGWYLVGQTLQGPKTFIFNDFGWKEAGGDEQHGGYFEMLYEEPSKTLTVVCSMTASATPTTPLTISMMSKSPYASPTTTEAVSVTCSPTTIPT